MNRLIIFLIIIVFIIYKLEKCNSECFFKKFYKNAPPLFLLKFSEDKYSFLNRISENILIEDNLELIGYCPNGIELVKDGTKMKSTTKVVTYKCEFGRLTLTVGNETFLDKDSTEMLACSNYGDRRLFEKLDSDGCNKRNYAVVTYIADTIIILAESCFDIHKMKVSHLHYRTRSSGSTFIRYMYNKLVKEKKQKNPMKKKQPKQIRNPMEFEYQTDYIDDIMPMEASYEPKQPETPAIPRIEKNKTAHNYKLLESTMPLKSFFYTDNETRLLFPNQGQALIFVPTDLFPAEVYQPYFQNPFQNYENLQRFIGWPNIVNGNWRTFHKLLQAHSNKNGTYEVYLGISHTAIAPNLEDQCVKFIKLEVNGKKMHVPKYIWAYVYSNEIDEEFVVIGVNSPFYKYYDVEKDFTCKDICEDISWLKPLYASRKVLTFGYMLCCPVDTVQRYLDGFPLINKKQRLAIEY